MESGTKIKYGKYCSDEIKYIIEKTVERLPQYIKEYVFNNILFEDMTKVEGIYITNQEDVDLTDPSNIRPPIIVLNFQKGITESAKMYVVAHEIAHFITEAEKINREEIADNLAKEWGFTKEYEAYKEFKKEKQKN